MNNIKVLEKLEDNKYIIQVTHLDSPVKKGININHDFIEFYDTKDFKPSNELNKELFIKDVPIGIQIPIRMFFKLVLPLLNNHKYLTEDHLKDRVHDEDDRFTNPPEYKKGDTYTSYSYYLKPLCFHFHENKIHKVAVLMPGEKEVSIVTYEFWKTYIIPTL